MTVTEEIVMLGLDPSTQPLNASCANLNQDAAQPWIGPERPQTRSGYMAQDVGQHLALDAVGVLLELIAPEPLHHRIAQRHLAG